MQQNNLTMEIIFSKKAHEYTSVSEGKTQTCISVTTILKKYKNFDVEIRSLISAAKKLSTYKFKKYKDSQPEKVVDEKSLTLKQDLIDIYGEALLKKQEELKKEWRANGDKAANEGSRGHDEKELESFERGWELNKYTGKKCNIEITPEYNQFYKGKKVSFVENLSELKDGFYPELLVWLFHESGVNIAGQADKVFIETIDGVRYLDIDDYKFVKEVKKGYNYLDWKGQPVIKTFMKAPLNHLVDSNWSHYALQMSFYAYILEQSGFVVRNLRFTAEKQKKDYVLPYLREEVINILNESK